MSDALLDDANIAMWVGAMSSALTQRDEKALRKAVAGFDTARKRQVTSQVRRVANNLQFALDHFQSDPRLVDLAQRQAPDARLRLAHVLSLTDEAAHRTMDLVERSCPLADQASAEAERLMALQKQACEQRDLLPQLVAFVPLVASSMSAVRSNLAEVLIAQGFQDLSGQIIRAVITLIQQLESALSELMLIAGSDATGIRRALPAEPGPPVPGIAQPSAVAGQQDVDTLLQQLGV